MSSLFTQGGADPANGGFWFEAESNINVKSDEHKFILDEEPIDDGHGYFGKIVDFVSNRFRNLLEYHT